MSNPSLSKINTSKERPAAVASSARQPAAPSLTRLDATTEGSIKAESSARSYVLAWAMALIFYVLEYSTRSAPGVMIPELERAFSRDGVGVGNILGTYYYTYSLTSLVAGLALDRYGAKYVVPIGSAILGVGCLLFIFGNSETAYLARLLQGAGSAFAFTGAVYLASRGFSSNRLATAIGVTQSLGMLGARLENSSSARFCRRASTGKWSGCSLALRPWLSPSDWFSSRRNGSDRPSPVHVKVCSPPTQSFCAIHSHITAVSFQAFFLRRRRLVR